MSASPLRYFFRALTCAFALAGGAAVAGAEGPIIEFKLPPAPPPKPTPPPDPEETPASTPTADPDLPLRPPTPSTTTTAPDPNSPPRPRTAPTRPATAMADPDSSVPAPAPASPPAPALPPSPAFPPVPVKNWLEAQVALAREGFSSGPIDGVGGAQSASALRAYQESHDIPATGALDAATKEQLLLAAPLLTTVTLTEADLASLQPLDPTWLGKSQQTSLAYETALELLAERAHASPNLIRLLNPRLDWSADPEAGTVITVPAIPRLPRKKKAARVVIQLAAHTLEVFDADDAIIAHFPVSIAAKVEKRPAGELHVVVVAPNPDYTFNPEVFPESEEARNLGRKLILPPGPNNPVGLAWIGLDLPGYGIHGTPKPEQVGRTESHGCFRLANWDALTLLDFTWIGLPIVVVP